MIRINPLDLSFLLLERPTRPFHMSAMTIFAKPKGQQSTFGPRLFDAYRHSQAVKPFNYKLKWLGRDIAAWETVEPDMRNHIRRIDLPAPGSMQQFYETVSFLNAGLLDRGHPLWECYIIDGIENGRLAVMIKVHHALIDGEGGLRVMRNFLSDSPRDKRLAGPWMALKGNDTQRRSRPAVSQIQRLQSMLSGLTKLPGDVIGILKPQAASLPFAARHTLFNNTAKSAARAYADTRLPLADVKAVAKATETSVNDVVMTVVDDALHHYLRDHQAPTDQPLVAFMPMSLRDESGGGGNQVSAELIEMGAPAASLRERLHQINRATQQAKDRGRRMQTTSRQAYALLLFASQTMADLPWFDRAPSANLVISNMKGPTEQLYLAGAPLVEFLGLPILPPGAGLNVTFASVHTDIGIAVGAAPEAVDEPFHLVQLIEQAFQRLQADTGTQHRTRTTS